MEGDDGDDDEYDVVMKTNLQLSKPNNNWELFCKIDSSIDLGTTTFSHLISNPLFNNIFISIVMYLCIIQINDSYYDDGDDDVDERM